MSLRYPARFATRQSQAIYDGRTDALTKLVHCVCQKMSLFLAFSTMVCFCHCGDRCHVHLLCWTPQQHGHLPTVISTSTYLRCATSLLRSLSFNVSTRCEDLDLCEGRHKIPFGMGHDDQNCVQQSVSRTRLPEFFG